MSEFSTHEVVKQLSKMAELEDQKGHYQQAEHLYKSIFILEEMAGFPADQIKEAKLDADLSQAKREAKEFLDTTEVQNLYEKEHGRPSDSNDNGVFRQQKPSDSNDNGIFRQQKPSDSNDNGIFRQQKPSDSNDNGIFRQQKPSDSNDNGINGRPHWQLPALDMSDSMHSQKLESAKEHLNIIEPDTGSTRLIDTETEWLEKTNKQLPISTDSDGLYPSKGCP